MRCQTEERGAEMTADSVMEVEVGIAVDILSLMGSLVCCEAGLVFV